MGLRISPLKTKIVFGSNPLKCTMLVGRLGVHKYIIVFKQPVCYHSYAKLYHMCIVLVVLAREIGRLGVVCVYIYIYIYIY